MLIELTPEEQKVARLRQEKQAQTRLRAEAQLKGHGEFLHANPQLRLSRADFCGDDEQAAAWRQALAQLMDRDNPSVEGILRFLSLGKPLSARLAAALAYLLRGSVVFPVYGPQPQDIGLLPERLGEIVVQPWANPKFRKRSRGRSRDPESWEKAREAAAEVARRKAKEPDTALTLLIAEVAEEHGVSPSRVGDAYEMLGDSKGQNNSK